MGAILGIVLSAAGVLAVSVVIGALGSVLQYFKTALYEYAADGVAHGGYDVNQMRASFRRK
ncbi:hypothetical protein [Candidatus Poriferisodalis sp.]|uniref:hypothetical protein n=1 Tax=Candidatus Poriferisodalis sp. TaxID=3101277 RepID=UPI003B02749C